MSRIAPRIILALTPTHGDDLAWLKDKITSNAVPWMWVGKTESSGGLVHLAEGHFSLTGRGCYPKSWMSANQVVLISLPSQASCVTNLPPCAANNPVGRTQPMRYCVRSGYR
ncbi:hypothetical protein IG631_24269 [Alternaria alternata]|nr:hypothetical protein IG631_24269 [Alternaria alternata]